MLTYPLTCLCNYAIEMHIYTYRGICWTKHYAWQKWSPHGLKPVVPPHASEGGTLRSIPHYARMSFVGYPPRIHRRVSKTVLARRSALQHAGVVFCVGG